jgi:hypothetical protein
MIGGGSLSAVAGSFLKLISIFVTFLSVCNLI